VEPHRGVRSSFNALDVPAVLAAKDAGVLVQIFYHPNSRRDELLQACGELEGLPADLVLPGQGEPWTGGAAKAVQLARDAWPS